MSVHKSSKWTLGDITSGRAASPPDYQVSEDSRGNLVNRGLKVKWPERPSRGYHSVDAYRERKSNQRRAQLRSQLHSEAEPSSGYKTTAYSRTDSEWLPDIPVEMHSRYAGVQSAASVARHLKPSFSVLYYRQDLAVLNLNAVPLTLDLWLAYMDVNGHVTQYAMRKKILNGKSVWKAEPSDEEQPCFDTLIGALLHFDHFGTAKLSFDSECSECK